MLDLRVCQRSRRGLALVEKHQDRNPRPSIGAWSGIWSGRSVARQQWCVLKVNDTRPFQTHPPGSSDLPSACQAHQQSPVSGALWRRLGKGTGEREHLHAFIRCTLVTPVCCLFWPRRELTAFLEALGRFLFHFSSLDPYQSASLSSTNEMNANVRSGRGPLPTLPSTYPTHALSLSCYIIKSHIRRYIPLPCPPLLSPLGEIFVPRRASKNTAPRLDFVSSTKKDTLGDRTAFFKQTRNTHTPAGRDNAIAHANSRWPSHTTPQQASSAAAGLKLTAGVSSQSRQRRLSNCNT